MIENTKQLFFFLDLKLVIDKTNIFAIKEVFLLPVFLSAINLEEENDDFLSFVISDNDTLPPIESTSIYYIPNGYEIVAYYLALSTMTQSHIYKPLSYN